MITSGNHVTMGTTAIGGGGGGGGGGQRGMIMGY